MSIEKMEYFENIHKATVDTKQIVFLLMCTQLFCMRDKMRSLLGEKNKKA